MLKETSSTDNALVNIIKRELDFKAELLLDYPNITKQYNKEYNNIYNYLISVKYDREKAEAKTLCFMNNISSYSLFTTNLYKKVIN